MAFAFTWVIENYSPRLHDIIKKYKSPFFYFNRSKWFLTLESFTIFDENNSPDDCNISCCLQRYKDGRSNNEIFINFKIEIIDLNLNILHTRTFENQKFLKGGEHGWLNCLKHSNVFDIITSNQQYFIIRCFLSEATMPMTVKNYYAVRNVICSNSHSFPWIVKYEDTPEWSKSRIFKFPDQSPFKIRVQILNDDVLIDICKVNAWTVETQVVFYSLHWLDINGKVVEEDIQAYSATNYWNNIWKFQSRITKTFMKTFLLNPSINAFKLIINLMVSTGVTMKVESTKSQYNFPCAISYQPMSEFQSYSNLFPIMKDIHVNKQNCDVKIRIDGRCFLVHKSILKVRAPHLLEARESEDSFIIIDLHNCNPKTLEHLLRFFYNGTLNGVSFEDILKLIDLANSLDCYHLVHECQSFLGRNLTIENVIETLFVAIKMELSVLQDNLSEFIRVHATEIFASPKQLELDENSDPITREVLSFINNSV